MRSYADRLIARDRVDQAERVLQQAKVRGLDVDEGLERLNEAKGITPVDAGDQLRR